MLLPLVLATIPVSLVLPQEVRQEVSPLPAGLVSGDAIQAVVGLFDADVISDVAVLHEDGIVLTRSPGRIHTFRMLSGSFGSIGKVSLSGADGLLATTHDGIDLVTWNPTGDGSLESTPVLADEDWSLATQLQVIEAPERTWVCAVAGSTVLVGKWTGNEVVPVTSLRFTQTVLAMAGVFWDGDTDLDVAVDLGSGLQVLDLAGTVIGQYSSTSSAPRLLRLPVPNAGDGLLWITAEASSSTGQILASMTAGSGGAPQVAQYLELLTTIPAAMTLARFDGDGLQDVVLSFHYSAGPKARPLYRIDASHFGVASSPSAPAGLELDLSAVWDPQCDSALAVAAGDLDGDGDDDLVYAGDPGCSPQIEVVFANGVDQEASFEDVPGRPMAWVFDSWVDWEEPALWIRAWGAPTYGPADSATDLQVRLFSESIPGKLVQVGDDQFFPVASAGDELKVHLPATIQSPVRCEFSYVRRVNGTTVQAFPAWYGVHLGSTEPCNCGGGSTVGGFQRPPNPPQQLP